MRYQEMQRLSVAGREGWLLIPVDARAPLPAVYLACGDDFPDYAGALIDLVHAEGSPAPPFVLAAFSSADWNHDYAPWAAPKAFKKGAPFGDGAADTLAWLHDALVPYVERSVPVQPTAAGRTLLGYSLAGLFALWAALRCGDFLRIGSCSGSLWYDGFLDYLGEGTPAPHSRIYLSLGDQEANGKNARMGTVAEATQAAYALLKGRPEVDACTFQWQPGGHFTGRTERLSDAIRWLQRG